MNQMPKPGEGIPTRPGSTERGYTYRWQRARMRYLRTNLLCRMCAELGHTTAANIVDHIHRHAGPGDPLFWYQANWQALCYRCHDSAKQSLDRTGVARGHDAQGWRITPLHQK